MIFVECQTQKQSAGPDAIRASSELCTWSCSRICTGVSPASPSRVSLLPAGSPVGSTNAVYTMCMQPSLHACRVSSDSWTCEAVAVGDPVDRCVGRGDSERDFCPGSQQYRATRLFRSIAVKHCRVSLGVAVIRSTRFSSYRVRSYSHSIAI